MMKITYSKYDSNHNPVSVSWSYLGKQNELNFDQAIIALYSPKLNVIVIELLNKLYFYSLDGSFVNSEDLPTLDNYQYRGLNLNNKSQTGISFLFFPQVPSEKNQWQDIEQYEMNTSSKNRVGSYLGIYR